MNSTRVDTVLIYSGGLDSTTLLYKLMDEKKQVVCLGFNYNQRHRKELESARTICFNKGLEFYQMELPFEVFKGSSQTSPSIPVPLGHYEHESMKLTVVPNRNMVMLSLAAAYAISIGATEVAYAAHGGDHAIYPDCREEFVDLLDQAFGIVSEGKLTLNAPFTTFSKADIVSFGKHWKVPFELTWSCYVGTEFHCGACGTCVERQEAFRLSGIPDPTIYTPAFTSGAL